MVLYGKPSADAIAAILMNVFLGFDGFDHQVYSETWKKIMPVEVATPRASERRVGDDYHRSV
jgi:hypothetical protein